MAHGFVHYTCCLIVLSVFVDRGDGQWKKKDRENLQDDIELFRKMADKIQLEIEDFYDEYSSKRLKQHILNSLLAKYKSNIESGERSSNITWEHEIKLHGSNFPNVVNNFSQKNSSEASKETVHTEAVSNSNSLRNSKVDKIRNVRWPKFEDILLEIGKRYDWKNDRWLKVKVKLKESEKDKSSENSIDVHEKHKFHYKIVKLNKSKNRRNVVVAVSAVR